MKNLTISIITLLLSASCNNADPWGEMPGMPDNGMQGGMQGGSTTASIEGLTDFDVSFNYNALNESETIPSDNEDYIENSDFTTIVSVKYNGAGQPEITGITSDVSITTDGGNVVATAKKSCKFILSGSSNNGRFKLYSEKKSAIVLSDVSLTNPTGAVINVQSKKRTFLVLADGTENTLTDGKEYVTEYDPSDATSAEKQKGTYYSKGQTIISGKGILTIKANYKHGIDTKDYLRIRPNTNIAITATQGNCIKCEDTNEGGGIIIEGGVLNLDNQSTAGKGLSGDGEITIHGGRLTAICTGDGEWDGDDAEVKDVSGASCIKSDGKITIDGGDIWLKSTGKGGKGINSDSDIMLNGGTIHVKTTGTIFSYKYSNLTYDTSPKGIKSNKNITINGAEVYVQAIGASDGSEGVEAKEIFTLNSGKVKIYAADDGLNAGYSSDGLRDKQKLGQDITGLKANAGQVVINGGEMFSYSTSNDGIDANGTITINGGTAVSFGANMPEEGFDCDKNTFTVTGGLILGFGGASSTPTENTCKQPCVLASMSLQSGNTYTLKDASGNELVSLTMPRTYSGAVVLLSSPSFVKGNSYTFGNSTITCSSSLWVTGSGGGFGGGMNGGGFGGFPGGGW